MYTLSYIYFKWSSREGSRLQGLHLYEKEIKLLTVFFVHVICTDRKNQGKPWNLNNFIIDVVEWKYITFTPLQKLMLSEISICQWNLLTVFTSLVLHKTLFPEQFPTVLQLQGILFQKRQSFQPMGRGTLSPSCGLKISTGYTVQKFN